MLTRKIIESLKITHRKGKRSYIGRSHNPLYGKADLLLSPHASQEMKTRSKVLPAIILILFSFGVIVAAAASAIIISNRKDTRADMCLKGSSPDLHVAFIVDLTDGLSDSCFDAFRDELEYRLGWLKPYEWISLYVIKNDAQYGAAKGVCLFSHCRPRDGIDANPIIENKTQITNFYEKEFKAPLQKAIKSIDPDHSAKQSPILETFYQLYRMPVFANAKKREVYYFGNLIENSELINQYETGWEDFSKMLKRFFRILDVKNSLSGADVTIFQTSDPKRIPLHTKWWENYFKFTSAETYTVKHIGVLK